MSDIGGLWNGGVVADDVRLYCPPPSHRRYIAGDQPLSPYSESFGTMNLGTDLSPISETNAIHSTKLRSRN